eukprot:5576628-Amphidinium_carterae.1
MSAPVNFPHAFQKMGEPLSFVSRLWKAALRCYPPMLLPLLFSTVVICNVAEQDETLVLRRRVLTLSSSFGQL